MKREYTSGTQDSVNFFVGKEIEKTPAYGMKTLFVVGVHAVNAIEKILTEREGLLDNRNSIRHIFFGANHSFAPGKDYAEWEQWERMIAYFLDNDYLCTLDIPLSEAEQFNDSCLCEYDNFIPQIRVPVPYIKLWNYNTMIKIDDKDFRYSNPGVWCHSLHDLMDRQKFTDRKGYGKDKVI